MIPNSACLTKIEIFLEFTHFVNDRVSMCQAPNLRFEFFRERDVVEEDIEDELVDVRPLSLIPIVAFTHHLLGL